MVFGYSLFLYSPYSFATRVEHAIAMGVGVHYIQYLGIVWLLNRNKYPLVDRRKEGWGLWINGLLSRNYFIRFAYLLLYGGIGLMLRQDGLNFKTLSTPSVLFSIPLGLQMIHYYLDAFIWKFSNPFIRRTVAPYLGPSRPLSEAGPLAHAN
jgi:hypothetical protein